MGKLLFPCWALCIAFAAGCENDDLRNEIDKLNIERSELQEQLTKEKEKLAALNNDLVKAKQEIEAWKGQANQLAHYIDWIQRITELPDFEFSFVGFKHNEKVVYIWDNIENAKTYISGNYNPEETLFGWMGLNSMFGKIDNTVRPPSLRFYISNHDIEILEFGKYRSLP